MLSSKDMLLKTSLTLQMPPLRVCWWRQEHAGGIYSQTLSPAQTLNGCASPQLSDGCQVGLFGDKIQFSQIFYNLVLNSMQAILEKGEITVRISTRKNAIRILFSDNGPGVSEENRKKIFEPFFSTKDPTSGNGGEGLGLFVVWNILKMYKGTIQLNPKFKDGAQFIIRIPVEEEQYEPSTDNRR